MRERKKLYRRLCCILCIFTLIFACINVSTSSVFAATVTEEPGLNVSKGFNQDSFWIAYGEKVQIKKYGSSKVTYQIADDKIASITSDGTITGLKQGRTYLTAKVNGKSYKCLIAVILPRISVNKDEITIAQENELSVTFKNRKEKEKLKLTVENNDIMKAVVSNYQGNTATITITPKKNGSTTLLIGRTNSLEQVKIRVTVKKSEELSAVEIYKKCSKATVEITSTNGAGEGNLGSGFFIGSDKIITNYHVIKGAKKISIVDYNGKELNVTKLYDYNEVVDLALLGVDADHESMEVSYEGYEIGERIYTIGSPYGLTGSFSDGVIAKTLRKMEEDVYYTQITAPISRGNSGGPLINSKGEAIGVITSTKPEGQNLNFAVPSTYFLDLNENSPKSIQTFYNQNS